ncbi:MAG TPA: hypothetical protein VFE47_31045 [Tepidisphaeraceae bacterium]|jgi:hypothetical protein|nr:hypothetical protein [Tepidisphaeraceae bacterium]
MDPPQDQRLSELLRRQREGLEDSAGKAEREQLADEYQQGLLRKSFGIVEAVRRGLRPSPQS